MVLEIFLYTERLHLKQYGEGGANQFTETHTFNIFLTFIYLKLFSISNVFNVSVWGKNGNRLESGFS